MDLTITTAPTKTSVSTGTVKKNKRVTHNLEDDLYELWIYAGDRYIQDECNISLMEQVLTLRIPCILSKVSLPRPPLISIESISYTPDGEAEQVISNPNSLPKRISAMIPVISTGLTAQKGEMTVVYKAGYAEGNKVPHTLVLASIMLASHYSTSREAAFMDMRVMNVEKKTVFGVDTLIRAYKIPNLGPSINGGY